ncbi:Raf kinase inhibitor-like protein, YbhB/YbcL family [Longilinea arvoryzae]|uniref:Raf kinase inhibitor-like protein, YbhB/YbcL family n=1 Tax=Longilinea arvoryzae TaxID=360412 RepID=A0A0S7BNM6_9CHLR|nr:YbhB/YbcL family Raf kinase inhibitor-like protein [Longilinea arvoryzae]GAP15643.1 Raf kinase inhibitor-like protein, YbhB/YbcL family [Longilinea arvoryzae]
MPFFATSLLQLALGAILAIIIAYLAYRFHTLNRSGGIAAAVLGAVVFGLGGLGWALLLLGFFISSSALTRLFRKRKRALDEKFSKGGQRDAGQVLANGGVAGAFVLLHAVFPQAAWPWAAFAGAMAAVNADTWATELGVLSREIPVLITTRRPVERGTSGGITRGGTLAAFGGAFLIGLLAALVWPGGMDGVIPFFTRAGWIGLFGLLGSLVDSMLGATYQAIYHCPTCNKETERHPLHTCGTPTTLKRGLPWLNNDWVNTACALSGAVLGLVVALLPGSPLLLAQSTSMGGDVMQTITFSTPAFANGQPIPQVYTCDGKNISPALQWSGVPAEAKSLALIVEDPDAPVGIFTHWVLYNLAPNLTGLNEGVPRLATLTNLGKQGVNDFRKTAYDGPCPPAGKAHRYYFRLYALDLQPNLADGLTRQKLLDQLKGHILAQGEWMGTYQR